MQDEYLFDFENLKNKYYDLNYKEVVKEINSFVGAGNKYFQENDPEYRTEKSDPGDLFLRALRDELQDILKPDSNGQVFK